MGSDRPIQILIEEVVLLIESSDLVLLVHRAPAHVKSGPEKCDGKDSVESSRAQTDAERCPEFLGGSVRIDELHANASYVRTSVKVVQHRTQGVGRNPDVAIHQQNVGRVRTGYEPLIESPSRSHID